MKKYLELMPQAPDARRAQDKIYIWEEKQASLDETEEEEEDEEEEVPSKPSK